MARDRSRYRWFRSVSCGEGGVDADCTGSGGGEVMFLKVQSYCFVRNG